MTNLDLSKNTYIWAHIGVILYHIITAVLLILSQYYFKNRKTWVVILSSILLAVSILSFVPILKNYNKIIIS